jgi:hypothetical protein
MARASGTTIDAYHNNRHVPLHTQFEKTDTKLVSGADKIAVVI